MSFSPNQFDAYKRAFLERFSERVGKPVSSLEEVAQMRAGQEEPAVTYIEKAINDAGYHAGRVLLPSAIGEPIDRISGDES